MPSLHISIVSYECNIRHAQNTSTSFGLKGQETVGDQDCFRIWSISRQHESECREALHGGGALGGQEGFSEEVTFAMELLS